MYLPLQNALYSPKISYKSAQHEKDNFVNITEPYSLFINREKNKKQKKTPCMHV